MANKDYYYYYYYRLACKPLKQTHYGDGFSMTQYSEPIAATGPITKGLT